MKDKQEQKLFQETRKAVQKHKKSLAAIDKWLPSLQTDFRKMTREEKLDVLDQLKTLYETLSKAQKKLPQSGA